MYGDTGLILRCFSKKEEQVQGNIRLIRDFIKRADVFFEQIDILVPLDKEYDDSDCGETAKILCEMYAKNQKISVIEVEEGDIFCELLNFGMVEQLSNRVNYSFVISSEAIGYLTDDNFYPMIDALHNGAKVSGLAIKELEDSILQGRIVNTFAGWDTESLLQVGGFDLRAAKSKINQKKTIQAWNEEKGFYSYELSGVEEIIPLIRLIKSFGPCVAPIKPKNNANWIVSDKERHEKKVSTKYERQMAFALSEGVDLSFIKGGIIKKYRAQK